MSHTMMLHINHSIGCLRSKIRARNWDASWLNFLRQATPGVSRLSVVRKDIFERKGLQRMTSPLVQLLRRGIKSDKSNLRFVVFCWNSHLCDVKVLRVFEACLWVFFPCSPRILLCDFRFSILTISTEVDLKWRYENQRIYLRIISEPHKRLIRNY